MSDLIKIVYGIIMVWEMIRNSLNINLSLYLRLWDIKGEDVHLFL